MTREKYLILRTSGLGTEILYEAARDLHGYKKSLYQFSNEFTIWPFSGLEKQKLLESFIDYYDKKFTLVLTSYKGKLIKIE